MNMPLVPMKAILDTVYAHQYAAAAFNVNTASQAEAIISVHEMFRAPAIVQGAELANGFMGGCADFAHSTLGQKRTGAANIAKAVKARADDGTVPVALHLDHGKSLESVKAAVEGGYTSVMIDGSALPLEDNIALHPRSGQICPSKGCNRRRGAGSPGRGSRITSSARKAPTPIRLTLSVFSRQRALTAWL